MRLVLIDDDELIVMALRTILTAEQDIEIAGTGTSGADAVRLFRELKPDILVTDIRMEGMSGLEASEQILKEDPDACVLLLTTFLDDEYIIRALRAGARGYLLKQDYASLVPAIRAAANGQSVFGNEITAKIPELLSGTANGTVKGQGLSGDLTEREVELAGLIAEGLSNKEIAARMFLSEGTVRNYLSVILDKLMLRDRTQLAVYYLTGKRSAPETEFSQ